MSPDKQEAYEVLRAIRKIVRAISEHSKYLSREVGLTVPQLICLKAIGDLEEGEVTVRSVSDQVSLSAATVSRIVDRLEGQGLVTRERRRSDRRKVFLDLTPAGFERYQTLPVPLQDRFVERFLHLCDGERDDLVRSLTKVVEMMEATDIDAAPLLTPGDDVKSDLP